MPNPFKNPAFSDPTGFIALSNALFEFLGYYPFSRRQRRIFTLACRQTIGYQKIEDTCTRDRLEEMTGMDKRAINRTLNELQRDNVLTFTRSGDRIRFSLNLNFESWGRFKEIAEWWSGVCKFRTPKSEKNQPQEAGPKLPRQGQKAGQKLPHIQYKRKTKIKTTTDTPVAAAPEPSVKPAPIQVESGGDFASLSKVKTTALPSAPQAKPIQPTPSQPTAKEKTQPVDAGDIQIPGELAELGSQALRQVQNIPTPDAQELLDETAAQVVAHDKKGDPIRSLGGYLASMVQRWRSGTLTSGIVARRRILAEKKRETEARKIEQMETARAVSDESREKAIRQADQLRAARKAMAAMAADQLEAAKQRLLARFPKGDFLGDQIRQHGAESPRCLVTFQKFVADEMFPT